MSWNSTKKYRNNTGMNMRWFVLQIEIRKLRRTHEFMCCKVFLGGNSWTFLRTTIEKRKGQS